MSVLWEKSSTWRWLVRMTRDSKPFFFTFAALCAVVPGAIGYGVMQLTNSRIPQLESKLRNTVRPDSQRMAEGNREMLAQFFGELQRKDGVDDRYAAALRGQILTRNPNQRIQPVDQPAEMTSSKPAEVSSAKTSDTSSVKSPEATTEKKD